MTLESRACPRCRGYVVRDLTGDVLCLLCGHRRAWGEARPAEAKGPYVLPMRLKVSRRA